MARKKITRKKKSKKIKRPSDNMTDGINDTEFGDELRAQQGGQPSQPSDVIPPNEGTEGTNFRDFLKEGDLASGQSENDITDTQRDELVKRQVAFETQQANQAQAATEPAQPEVSTGDPSMPGQDEMVKQTELLIKLLATNDAMSENLAAIAAAMERSGDSAVRLGSSN